jgi:mono/diheme cytochrome c family protein
MRITKTKMRKIKTIAEKSELAREMFLRMLNDPLFLVKGVKRMKKICMIIVVALLLIAPLSLVSQNKADGAQLFKSKCAACHGDKGEGKPDMNMPAVKGTALTLEELVTYLTKGQEGKTIHANPVGDLKADEAKAVAEFVKGLK